MVRKIIFIVLLVQSLSSFAETLISTDMMDFYYEDRIDNSLNSLFNNKRYKTLSMEDFSKRVVQNSFDSRQAAEKVYISKAKVLESYASLFPRLQLGLSPKILTIAASGLLGAFVPSNWFNIASSSSFSAAESFSFLSVVLNQYYAAKIFYLNLSKLHMDYAIYDFYGKNLSLLISQFENDLKSIENETTRQGFVSELNILKNLYYNVFRIEKLTLEKEIKNLMAEIPYLMGEKKGQYYFPFIDLTQYDVSTQTKLFDNLDTGKDFYPLNNNVINLVTDRSYELLSLSFLKDEAYYQIWGSSFSFFQGDNDLMLSFHPGIVGLLMGKYHEYKNIKIAYDKMESFLIKDINVLFNEINMAHNIFQESLHGVNENERSFREFLTQYLKTEYDNKNIDGLIHLMEYGLDLELKRNDALYSKMMAEAAIAKLTHIEIEKLKDILPLNAKSLSGVKSILELEEKFYKQNFKNSFIVN